MLRRIHAVLKRALWIGWAILPLALVAADPPSHPNPADFEQLLAQGHEFETAGQWGRALEHYEKFSKAHPNDSQLLRERVRHCEIHYGLARRYHDPSFRGRLLTLSRTHALKLYDEVTKRIDDYYVDRPDHAKLFRNGIENLLEALDDEAFRAANLAGAGADQIAEFREKLRRSKSTAVRDRAEARQQIASLVAQAESLVSMQATPAILEFVYAACDSLDDYSACLTPNRLSDLYAVIDGNFVGIGVELRSDDAGLLVLNSLAGGPAAEAGIKSGDHIVAVGSTPTVGLSTEEAANMLQGADGTQVQLWIRSPDESSPRRVVLRRRSVDVQSVCMAHLVSPAEGIAYAQLSGFQKSTVTELEHAVASLARQGMQSLILDLRGNPGGLLTAAVDVSEKFLDNGVIVTTRGRGDGQSNVYRAQRGAKWKFPLVMLIDGDSASASEILAGAMQDNRRATIVGTKSYGKGSVQSIFPLDTADAGIRLTTAKFFSPKGRPYTHQGVSPDIEVRRETAWRPSGSTISQLNPADDAQLAAAIQASRQLLGRKN